jgi:hypothetical protein
MLDRKRLAFGAIFAAILVAATLNGAVSRRTGAGARALITCAGQGGVVPSEFGEALGGRACFPAGAPTQQEGRAEFPCIFPSTRARHIRPSP